MRIGKVSLATVLAVVLAGGVFGVVTGSSAAAQGEILGSVPESWNIASGKSTWEATGSAIIVKCTSSEGTLTSESATTGKFDELFLGCTASGVKCTGLRDTTPGSILFKGTVEFLDFKNGEMLDLAVVYTLEPVHYECLGILSEIKGSVIGLVTNACGEKTTALDFSFTGSKGKQAITSVNGVEHVLLSETNGGAFVEYSLTQLAMLTGTFEHEVMC